MGEQPFQILLILLECPGGMVTREQLREKLWANDTFVDFDHGLNSAVQRLRDCLSDSAASSARWNGWMSPPKLSFDPGTEVTRKTPMTQ
jgi:DNA-binding response OmpR family regulator